MQRHSDACDSSTAADGTAALARGAAAAAYPSLRAYAYADHNYIGHSYIGHNGIGHGQCSGYNDAAEDARGHRAGVGTRCIWGGIKKTKERAFPNT